MMPRFAVRLHLHCQVPPIDCVHRSPGMDSALEPDQSLHEAHVPIIKGLLAEATGKDADGKPLLTIEDLSRYSSKRRVEAKETNTADFTLADIHKKFGSSK